MFLITLIINVASQQTFELTEDENIQGGPLQYTLNDKQLNIPTDCRQVSHQIGYVDILSTKDNVYYQIEFTCNDIVDDQSFLDAENEKNSTITTDSDPNIDDYKCYMEVNFDGGDYCCCPSRKQQYDIQNKDLKLMPQDWLD